MHRERVDEPRIGRRPGRCEAVTKTGRRCNRKTAVGEKLCSGHEGGKLGRRTKLTPDVRAAIVDALRAGCYVGTACARAGIAERTYYAWLEAARAEGAHEELVQFSQAITRASAEAETHAIANVRKAMGDDWRSAAWYLERRHPARWRRREAVEHTGPEGGPVEVSEARYGSDPETRDLVRRLLAKAGEEARQTSE